jgi:hypothetical protein
VWLGGFVVLFVLGLLPRLAGVGEATTEDEDQWIQRSGNFARALASGRLEATYQVGHPGVTTMWVSSLALGQERVRQFASQERSERLVTQVDGFLSALHTARVSFAFLNTLLSAACGLLAWRLLGAGPGLLASLLLAFDPYWSAMSPIVGMDGLLAGLMAAALLSALLAFRDAPGAAGWALLSGLAAGLGLVTKGPAVLLPPLIILMAAGEYWRQRRQPGAWRVPTAKLAIWLVASAAAVAVWPAMWLDPLATARRTADFVRGIGTSPHAPGNFFLGQPVSDPGPLFYPVALGLHLGPATFLGLLALLVIRPPHSCRHTLGLLVDFVVLFGLALTLSPKKVDRYLLPLLPVFDVLAGVGWWLAIGAIARRWITAWVPGTQRAVVPTAALALSLLQVWPLLAAGSHPLSAYNPLVGGLRAAEQAIPVGWGEGLDSVGQYLKRQDDYEALVTAIWYPLYVNFQAHAPGQVVNITFRAPGEVSNQQLLGQADYYVDYIHARQRRLTPGVLTGREPEHVVTINGAEYARVYRLD